MCVSEANSQWLVGGNSLSGTGSFGSNSNHDVQFKTAGLTRMTLKNNGNLLLGDGYPVVPSGAKLSIRQGWSDWIQLHRTASTGFWRFHNPASQDRIAIYYTDGSYNSAGLSIWNNGKVSIGTDVVPGSYGLYVSDGILAGKLRIATVGTAQWADYVFGKDYTLRTYSELEDYILREKHLPGIPSAQEVENDGIDVVDTMAQLLAKIEELTLYVIDLNKRVKELECHN